MAVRIRFRRFIEVDTEAELDVSLGDAEALFYTLDTLKYWRILSGVFEEVPEDQIFQKLPIEVTDINISGTPTGDKVLGDDGSWTPQTGGGGSGTPGGSDTQVQFNDGGAFGAEAAFTYNKTTNTLQVDAINLNGETASRIVATDGSKNLDTPYTFLDEDTMSSDSATGIPSQQSVKAYVDNLHGYWRTLPGTPTRSSNTVLTITDTSNANLYDLKFNRGTVLKWDDTTVHHAMVVSATYAANTVTITIIGDVLSGTATMNTFKYALEKADKVTFAIAGTIATGSDLSRKWKADKPYRVFGADALHGTAGTTNATTYELLKNGSANSMFTTDISIASGATVGDGYTADDNISLALDDVVSLSCNTVSTTAPIDVYVDMFIFPTYNQYL